MLNMDLDVRKLISIWWFTLRHSYRCSSFVSIFCSVVTWENSLPDVCIMLTFGLKLVAPWEKSIKRQKNSCQTLILFFLINETLYPSFYWPPYSGEAVCISVPFVLTLSLSTKALKNNKASTRANCYQMRERQPLLALPCAACSSGHRMEGSKKQKQKTTTVVHLVSPFSHRPWSPKRYIHWS